MKIKKRLLTLLAVVMVTVNCTTTQTTQTTQTTKTDQEIKPVEKDTLLQRKHEEDSYRLVVFFEIERDSTGKNIRVELKDVEFPPDFPEKDKEKFKGIIGKEISKLLTGKSLSVDKKHEKEKILNYAFPIRVKKERIINQ